MNNSANLDDTAGKSAPATPRQMEEPKTPPDADNFYQSEALSVQRVRFRNQYQMQVAGNLYLPKDLAPDARLPAIIVGHPMGAVKEQSSNLYAQKLAEQGFATLAIDLSFWGESGGEPRNVVAPDIYSEDFSAAVDFLGMQPQIDRERIGVLGICGSGSFAISAAKIDPRMKAIATVSMYDMGAANRDALHKSQTLAQRKAIIEEAARQRWVEYEGGATRYTSGSVHQIDADTPPVAREFYAFYRTPRGEFTPARSSRELTTHPTLSSNTKFMNFYPFNDIETISPRPLLFVTGEDAHSREFSERAYELAAAPKEILRVPGAGHVDLYDRVGLIPFARLADFFRTNLVP
nr:alpha/beta hydrolase [Cephaloticoccus primus]